MTISRTVLSIAAIVGLVAGSALAVTIETVPVGNPGNPGEWSGQGYNGYGPWERICGRVDYAYNIGKYEVTAGQYTEFLNAVAQIDTYELYNITMDRDYLPEFAGCNIKRIGAPGNYSYTVASEWANRPVTHVSFWDACRFANWLHNGQPTGLQGVGTTETGAYTLNGYNGDDGRAIQRNANWQWAITSEDEWYKAAYHKNDGTTGNYWAYPTSSDILPVGHHKNSPSPYGTYQGGNVSEWNESVVFELTDLAVRGLRGGSFSDDGFYLHAAIRAFEYPTFETNGQIGFRVVQVPEPATMVMSTLAGLSMLVRRRGLGR